MDRVVAIGWLVCWWVVVLRLDRVSVILLHEVASKNLTSRSVEERNHPSSSGRDYLSLGALV